MFFKYTHLYSIQIFLLYNRVLKKNAKKMLVSVKKKRSTLVKQHFRRSNCLVW